MSLTAADAGRLGAKHWGPPDHAAALEFIDYSSKAGLDYFKHAFDEVSGAAKQYLSPHDTGAFVKRWMIERLDRQTPTSMIRLGDGEGNALFSALSQYPALTSYCLRQISKIWFGDAFVAEREASTLVDGVVLAMNAADLIGAPGLGTIESGFNREPEDLDVRAVMGMRGVYAFLRERYGSRRLEEKYWANTWYSRQLLPHYASIFGGRPFVGVVTCYEQLAAKLSQAWGVAETKTYLVPMQASVKGGVTSDIGHYPSVFEQIMKTLSAPYPGAPFIVAAGILGKSYCRRIKELGGFALDVGSVADVWMGRTRAGISAEFVAKWRFD